MLLLTKRTNVTPDQLKSLNQLCSVLAGGKAAKSTNHLSDDPLSRIEELLRIALADLSTAVLDQDDKGTKQAQRKIDSLQSLQVLASSLD